MVDLWFVLIKQAELLTVSSSCMPAWHPSPKARTPSDAGNLPPGNILHTREAELSKSFW